MGKDSRGGVLNSLLGGFLMLVLGKVLLSLTGGDYLLTVSMVLGVGVLGYVAVLYWPGKDLAPTQGLSDVDRGLLADIRGGNFDTLVDHEWPYSLERGSALYHLSPHLKLEQVKPWCAQAPNQPVARLIRGWAHTAKAWEIRGSGIASTVEEDAWLLFGEHLEKAGDDFRFAAAHLPDSPSPIQGLMYMAVPLGKSLEEREQLLRALIERDPENLTGHLLHLAGLTHRWGGDTQAMESFAGEVLQRAPLGSPLCAVVFGSLLEMSMAFAGPMAEVDALTHFGSKTSKDLCASLFDAYLAQGAPGSERARLMMFNYAAVWFYLSDDHPRLRRALEGVGDRPAESIWMYVGGHSEAAFQRARKEAQLGGLALAAA